MGYIKNARITRVFGGLLDVALELDIGAGIRCTTPYIRNTPEDNHIVFDFLGVSNWSQLKNKYIRVWIPGVGGTYFLEDVHMIGRERDNKWLDLKRREVVCCRVHWGFLYPVDEKREREETKMKTNYNAEYIKGFLKGQEDRLRQRHLDPDYIETLVEQSEYLIRSEMDPICLKYITLTFIEKISEHFYLGLNAKKYLTQTFEGIDVADILMLRAHAECAIGLLVVAGCTGDYPSITNQ